MVVAYENDFGFYSIEEDVLSIRYRTGVIMTLDTAKAMVADRHRIQEGLVYPLLCDIRGIVEIDRLARNYLALEGSYLIRATALVVCHPTSEAISEFYLHTTYSPVPTESFYNLQEALVFLREYL